MANFIFKKEDNLVYEDAFNDIEILTDISANTHKTIVNNSKKRKKNDDGEFEIQFDNEEYQIAMIAYCCKFDGKQLSKAEIARFERSFFMKLFLLLIPAQEEESQVKDGSESQS